MNAYRFLTLLIALTLSFPIATIADNNSLSGTSSAEFFASNNTNEIDLQTAFNRLRGEEQRELQNGTVNLMQKEHLEQSNFENLLGTYRMSSDQNVTADNSEKVITSPYQKLSSEKIFKIATELANILKQESVAVFIPTKDSMIGDTVLKLKSHHYTINETIAIIHEKLPPLYSQAFSLHLNNNMCSSFDNTTVEEVEWLGSKIKPDEIKKSFPLEEITNYHGKAYLVYKNGQREQL